MLNQLRRALDQRRPFLLLLLVLYCAPLLMHVYLGSYSRFMADDFCSSAVARSRGIIGGTVYWYTTWTGRFSANVLDSLFGYLGPRATPYATGLVVVTWFIALVMAVVQIDLSDTEHEVRLLKGGVIAAMVLFAVFEVIPFIGQSLYWGQGMRSVVPPLILGTFYFALVLHQSRSTSGPLSSKWIITAALLTFTAVGFAETYFAVQTTAIVFGLAISRVLRRFTSRNLRNCFRLLVAGLVGSLAGGLIMFVAPGNKFRQGTFPPPPPVPELLSISFRGLREFFQLIFNAPGRGTIWLGIFLCGFVFGLGLFRRHEKSPLRYHVWALIWLPVVAFVLLLACWLPMAWGTSLTLAYRTMIIPAYVVVCAVVCWAYVAGCVCESVFHLSMLSTRGVAVVLSLMILLAFGVVAVVRGNKMWKRRSIFAGYARTWDEREALIQSAKAQGLSYAVVYRLHNWAALDEIAVDPKITWLTKCVQDYYGIGVIPDLGDLYGEPDGDAKQRALEEQFDLITKLPGSVPTELDRIYHSVRGKIGFYKSDAKPDQIESYYETELTQLGWKYIGEKKVEAYPRISGGTHTLFCRGDVAAVLFITGQDEARLGYTYSLALNWGMSSGYVWGSVDCPR